MPQFEHDLYDEHGNRKYLTAEERQRFFDHIDRALAKPDDRGKRTFALLLYYTGCRISEGLAVTYANLDYSAGHVVFRTLKRRKTTYRHVPLPPAFLTKLDDVHHVKDHQNARTQVATAQPIWPYGRTTAWRLITSVMEEAGITGVQATPKGLRHGFVIEHQALGTPVHMIQKWAGWSSTSMMQVYGRATGHEERAMAERLWQR
jgi:integrase